jgi:hypothetical protein
MSSAMILLAKIKPYNKRFETDSPIGMKNACRSARHFSRQLRLAAQAVVMHTNGRKKTGQDNGFYQ